MRYSKNAEDYKTYVGDDMKNIIVEIILKENKNGKFLSGFSDITDYFDYTLYDDIKYSYDKDIFIYKGDSNIHIGETHGCAYMIYIAFCGDGCSNSTYDIIHIKEYSIKNLMKWIRMLKSQKRVHKKIKLALVPNCCS